MIREKDLIERLNFLKLFNKRVLLELDDEGRAEVLTLEVVPVSAGVYWIGGTTILKNGLRVDSVFRVNTESGGTLLKTYWWVGDSWYSSDDAEAMKALGCAGNVAFPFDWEYNTPLAEDIYHN